MSNNLTLGEAFLYAFLAVSVAVSVITCSAYVTFPVWWPRFVRWIIKHHRDSTANADGVVIGTELAVREQTAPTPVVDHAVRRCLLRSVAGPLPRFSVRGFFSRPFPYNKDHQFTAEAGFVHQSGEIGDTLPKYQPGRANSAPISPDH